MSPNDIRDRSLVSSRHEAAIASKSWQYAFRVCTGRFNGCAVSQRRRRTLRSRNFCVAGACPPCDQYFMDIALSMNATEMLGGQQD